MSPEIQTLLGVSAFLFALLGIIVVAFFRFRSAAKRMGQSADLESSESAFVAAAMAEAVTRIRTKEQAQQARADESERLSEDIVSGLTSGLMVVTADGGARIVNPAARRLLNLPTAGVAFARPAWHLPASGACDAAWRGGAGRLVCWCGAVAAGDGGARGRDADAELRGGVDQRAAAGRGDRGDAAHASADHAPRDRSQGARPAHVRRAARRHGLADRALPTGGFRD